MYYVDLENVAAQRTCLPVYEQHTAVAVPHFIDPAETGDIYSGMVLYKSGEDTVALVDTPATQKPYGIAALDRNADIDDTKFQGGSVPFAVWVGSQTAYFQVSAPAFDDGQSYAVPTDGTRELLYANASGQLTSVAVGDPVAELIEVVDADTLTIRLLPVTV